MTERLALFPLQLVAFPGEFLNLHVFEPRYRQLIEDAERNGIRFGVPTVMEGQLLPIATEVTLTDVAKVYESGESDVKTVGGRVFRLEDFDRVHPGKLYPGGKVTFLPIDHDENPAKNGRIIELTREIYRVLKVDRQVKEVSEGFNTYEIAHYVGLTLEQEYRLLTLRKASERQTFLIEHLEEVRPDVKDKLNIRARARLNGHFKELKAPDF